MARSGSSFRLPLEDYPVDSSCLSWGGYNSSFMRCGRPGKHVADDACAPNGTPVYAIADGRVRFAARVGDCFDNWGWVVVVEHTLPDQPRVCSIYGHCEPEPGVRAGGDVVLGQKIATIQNDCVPHIHFGIYMGAYGAQEGTYPPWLVGYLPNGTSCEQFPVTWPGKYVDPLWFVLDRVAVVPATWGRVKLLLQ